MDAFAGELISEPPTGEKPLAASRAGPVGEVHRDNGEHKHPREGDDHFCMRPVQVLFQRRADEPHAWNVSQKDPQEVPSATSIILPLI